MSASEESDDLEAIQSEIVRRFMAGSIPAPLLSAILCRGSHPNMADLMTDWLTDIQRRRVAPAAPMFPSAASADESSIPMLSSPTAASSPRQPPLSPPSQLPADAPTSQQQQQLDEVEVLDESHWRKSPAILGEDQMAEMTDWLTATHAQMKGGFRVMQDLQRAHEQAANERIRRAAANALLEAMVADQQKAREAEQQQAKKLLQENEQLKRQAVVQAEEAQKVAAERKADIAKLEEQLAQAKTAATELQQQNELAAERQQAKLALAEQQTAQLKRQMKEVASLQQQKLREEQAQQAKLTLAEQQSKAQQTLAEQQIKQLAMQVAELTQEAGALQARHDRQHTDLEAEVRRQAERKLTAEAKIKELQATQKTLKGELQQLRKRTDTEAELDQGKEAEELDASPKKKAKPEPGKLIKLNVQDNEYVLVAERFHASRAHMPAYNGLKFVITSIERIDNPTLAEQFNAALQYFYEKRYHSAEPIRPVYHGTLSANIASIVQTNLDMKWQGHTDSGYFGGGLYFSRYADYCMMYASANLELPTAGQSCKLLQFDILPGRLYELTDVKHGEGRIDLFDSHVSPTGFEYVVFDRDTSSRSPSSRRSVPHSTARPSRPASSSGDVSVEGHGPRRR